MVKDRTKYICEKCGYVHYFSKKFLIEFGNEFRCQKCGHNNVLPEEKKKEKKKK